MTRVRDRVNLILLCLVVALGATVLLLPDPGPEPPPAAVEYDPGSVDRVVLDRLGTEETLRLERRSDGWFMTRPRESRVDESRVARALGALREATDSCYGAAEHEPDEFGLHPPQAELRLDSLRVEFGYRGVDGRRYVRHGGRLCLIEDITLPILGGLAAQEAEE